MGRKITITDLKIAYKSFLNGDEKYVNKIFDISDRKHLFTHFYELDAFCDLIMIDRSLKMGLELPYVWKKYYNCCFNLDIINIKTRMGKDITVFHKDYYPYYTYEKDKKSIGINGDILNRFENSPNIMNKIYSILYLKYDNISSNNFQFRFKKSSTYFDDIDFSLRKYHSRTHHLPTFQ